MKSWNPYSFNVKKEVHSSTEELFVFSKVPLLVDYRISAGNERHINILDVSVICLWFPFLDGIVHSEDVINIHELM